MAIASKPGSILAAMVSKAVLGRLAAITWILLAVFLISACDDGGGSGRSLSSGEAPSVGAPAPGPGSGGEPGGGSGSNSGGGELAIAITSVFSHSSYHFVIGGNTTVSSAPSSAGLPSLLLDPLAIKQRVAQLLGITAETEIAALQEGVDYSIGQNNITIAGDDISDPANTFFSLARQGEGSDLIQIMLANPTGSELDLATIIANYVDSFEVLIIIYVPAANNGRGGIIESRVEVDLSPGGLLPLDELLAFNKTDADAPLNLTKAGEFPENTLVETNSTSLFAKDILQEFGISADTADGRTLFFDLRDASTPAIKCEIDGIGLYFDNTDHRVKSSETFNYEQGAQVPRTFCRLGVSQDGENYNWVALPVRRNLNQGRVNGTRVPNDVLPEVAIAKQVNATVSCDAGGFNDCYFATVEIAVSDVDEPPLIELFSYGSYVNFNTYSREQKFAGSYESVGGPAEYNSSILQGTLLAAGADYSTLGAPNKLVSNREILLIHDTDFAAGGRAPDAGGFQRFQPLQRDSISIRVTPSHGQNIFALVNDHNPDNFTFQRGEYNMTIDSDLLDYERFTERELALHSGRAIYKIEISVSDLGGKTARANFDYEVRDVIYRPIPAPVSFRKWDGIAGAADGQPLYLLSGTRSFVNNRHQIASFKAVDPETGTDDNLLYSFVAADASIAQIQNSNFLSNVNFARNFNLVLERDIRATNPRANFGSMLALSSFALQDGQSSEVTFMAIPESLAAAVADTDSLSDAEKTITAAREFSLRAGRDPRQTKRTLLQVRDAEYSELQFLPADSISFTFDGLTAAIGEGLVGPANASFQLIDKEGKGEPIASLLAAIDTSNTPGAAPRFGIIGQGGVELEDLLSTNATLATAADFSDELSESIGLFSIDAATGTIALRAGAELNFSDKPYHILPVYVINASQRAAALTLANLDIYPLTVLVRDVNSPPQFGLYSSPIADKLEVAADGEMDRVNLSLPEGVARSGATLLNFRLSDDNSVNYANLVPFTNHAALRTRINADGLVAVSLRRELNYENLPAGLDNVIISVQDDGSYEYDTASGQSKSRLAKDYLRTAVALNITVTDTPELPFIASDKPDGGRISEAAQPGDAVEGLGLFLYNADDYTIGGKFNPGDFNATLGGVFEEVFDLIIHPAAGEIAPMDLVLRDAAAAEILDNLGDGRRFPLNLQLTHYAGSGAPLVSAPYKVTIQILNDIRHSQVMGLDQLGFTLSESEVQDRDITATLGGAGFVLRYADFLKDADETLFNSDELFYDPYFRLDYQHFENNATLAEPLIVEPPILELAPAAGGAAIRVIGRDYIDADLFGDLGFRLFLTDRGGSGFGGASGSGSIRVNVTEAPAKAIRYQPSDAHWPYDANPHPAVYQYTYVQTPPAEPYDGPDSEGAVVDYTQVTAAGVAAGERIRLADGEVYDTTIATTAAGQAGFIARSPERHDLQVELPLNTSGELDWRPMVYTVDAHNRMVNNTDEFAKYFEIEVDNEEKLLRISQRLLPAESIAGEPTEYQALDTIPLFTAGDSRVLNFFIRAVIDGGADNAAFYDLAQFNVEVLEHSANQNTRLVRAGLVPSGETDFANAVTEAAAAAGGADWVLQLRANGEGLPDFALNNFDSGYDLLLEFVNPDGARNNEARSDISLALAAGTADGLADPGRPLADGANLVRLAPANTGGAVAATAAALVISDESPDFQSGAATYVKVYDFALARNLAGEAELVLEVLERMTDEFQQSRIIGAHTETLRIQVEDIRGQGPTNATMEVVFHNYQDGETMNVSGGALANFAEDSNYFANLGPEGNFYANLTYNYAEVEQPGALGRSVVAQLQRVDNSFSGQERLAQPHNPLARKFLEFVVVSEAGRDALRYLANGWGTQRLQFILSHTEPRGFGEGEVTYDKVHLLDVAVSGVNDPTSFLGGAGFDSIAAEEFTQDSHTTVSHTGRVTFHDDDLLFDTAENVLGLVTVSMSTSAGKIPPLGLPNGLSYLPTADDSSSLATIDVRYSITATATGAAEFDDASYQLGFALGAADAPDFPAPTDPLVEISFIAAPPVLPPDPAVIPGLANITNFNFTAADHNTSWVFTNYSVGYGLDAVIDYFSPELAERQELLVNFSIAPLEVCQFGDGSNWQPGNRSYSLSATAYFYEALQPVSFIAPGVCNALVNASHHGLYAVRARNITAPPD